MSITKEEFWKGEDAQHETKVCNECFEEYPAINEFFYKRGESTDGLDYKCKTCVKIYRSLLSREKDKIDENSTRLCYSCGEEYPATLEYFHKDKSKRGGIGYMCIECANNVARKHQLKHDYNMTIEEYDEMNRIQSGKCLICGKKGGKRLHVDHDHDTGKIRGLLCHKCNTGIGMLGDNVQNLLSAAEYLKEHKG